MPNHLADENSPYLLQHASNPVDWYPWGQEALDRSKRENKPIFLSIGYAACHWCHVMAHESFEDPKTAELLNANFISIKVDREQRPDLDSIYMEATQSLSGSGGWPMSVFLTPDLRPFYAGTYFPPERRYNMPAFREVLDGVLQAWRENPAKLRQLGDQVVAEIGKSSRTAATAQISRDTIENATSHLLESYDDEHGGWGGAPKFPQPMLIEFLLERAANSGEADSAPAQTAFHALKAMARGGMYDVAGGGFSRYSTDNYWRVPHFEKMLYDNAQLALVYLHAWQLSHDAFYRRIVVDTLNFVARELTDPLGGVFSSLDADSADGEGRFYTWTKDEVHRALGDGALFELFVAAYGLTDLGNWEGVNVLQRVLDDGTLAAQFKTSTGEIRERMTAGHARLLEARATRPRPSTDDKVLAGWNGLMLRAFAQASRFLDDASISRSYLEVATRNAAFLLTELRPDGRLRRTWRRGVTGTEVFLEDYAGVMLGLLDLYQATFDNRWFAGAQELARGMIERFTDPDSGFFDTAADAAALPLRPKDLQDNAVPSGNALACEALLRLAALGGDGNHLQIAHKSLEMVAANLGRYPTAFGHWLSAASLALAGEQQLAIVFMPGADPTPLVNAANSFFRPSLVTAASTYPPPDGSPAVLSERPLLGGRPTAYVCHAFTCRLPVTSPEALLQEL